MTRTGLSSDPGPTSLSLERLGRVLEGGVSRGIHALTGWMHRGVGEPAQPPRLTGKAVKDEGFGRYTKAQVEEIVDKVAFYNLHLSPSGSTGCAALLAPGTQTTIGLRTGGIVESLDIEVPEITLSRGVTVINRVGNAIGDFSADWLPMPDSYVARMDSRPPMTRLDPTRSQRIALQHLRCSFGDGGDGFVAYGVGRTLPMHIGGELRLTVALFAEVVETSGRFAGHAANLEMVGELTADLGFVGHVILRFIDLDGSLRAPEVTVSPPPARDLDSEYSYLAWLGQKGEGPEQVNTLSRTRDGRLRGGNVATVLRRGRVTLATDGSGGPVAGSLQSGEVIGREFGFGAIDPRLAPLGTPNAPFPFDGVAQYDFFDESGEILGGFSTTVMEGRRIDIDLGLENQPTYRFGFFGAIVAGFGCMRGATGIFYGSSGSVFNIPPGGQVVTHFYLARFNDPEGRFRAPGELRNGRS